MRSDKNGCSQCPPGEEQWERFGERVQYDYRTRSGVLFSCVAATLNECRERRDRWVEERAKH
jgi:hypothetical protein